MMEFLRLQNADHGSIPDYWNVPLNSYNTELCFVTKDSVVAAPKLLMRTIFPELDSMLCPGCVETHERITVIIKDLESSEIVEAFKSLASGDPDHIARVLELKTSYPNRSQETETEIEYQRQILDIEEEEHDEAADDSSAEKNTVEEKVYKCRFCNSISSTKVANLRHMSEDHGIKIYSCKECDFVSKYYSSLRTHKAKRHGFVRQSFPCNLCNYKARSEERLQVHKKTKCFEKLPEDETPGSVVSCKKCDFTAVSKSSLKIHTAILHTKVYTNRKKEVNSYAPIEKESTGRCAYCSYMGKNVSQHERECIFKGKTIQSYKSSMLFQDSSFGWL